MEDQEKVDPEYLKGFNEGYLMALYLPEFVDHFANVETDNPRSAGFLAGRNQLVAEKDVSKNILPPWLNNIYNRELSAPGKDEQNEKDRGMELDKE